MRRRIIEGTWDCTSCGSKAILGRHKLCPSCGNPREAVESEMDFGARTASGGAAADTVTDAAAVSAAEAGRDWHCGLCGSANRGDATHCKQCSAPRSEAATAPSPPAETAKPAPVETPDKGRARLGCLAMVAGLLVLGWWVAPAEVQAEVVSRTWNRETIVERLGMTETSGWRSEMPAQEAAIPGSGALRDGRGAVHGCEEKACWPRPTEGKTLARVMSRQWRHEVRTKRMVSVEREGWRERVPTRSGKMPVSGQGGQEGIDGRASCNERERTPERCRQEVRDVPCGTEEVCEVRDLENGFAEEICRDVPKVCEEDVEVCTPAVSDDWCRWQELEWQSGRSAIAEGRFEVPRWPELVARAGEVLVRDATYTVSLETILGEPRETVTLSDARGFGELRTDSLVFATASSASPLPPSLVPSGEAVDCGEAIPPETKATRDMCRYQVWSWTEETPRLASDVGGWPAWPTVALGEDGRETRRAWVDLELGWTYRDQPGRVTVSVAAEEADRWPEGRKIPVKVSHEAELLEYLDASPVPLQAD